MKRFGTLLIGILIGAGLTFSTGAFAATKETVTAFFTDLNISVNGKAAELQARPLSYNGTTYLPVRDVANLTGYDVTYKADSGKIELQSKTGAAATSSAKGATKVQGTVYKLGDTVQFTGATFKLTATEYLLTGEDVQTKAFSQTFEPKAGEKVFRIKYEAFVSEEPNYSSKSIDFIQQVTTNDGRGFKSILVPLLEANLLKPGAVGSYDVGIIVKSSQTVQTIHLKNPLNPDETADIQVSP
ncbi:hypothetical protein VE23_24900 [Paenibacillus sp. D9]|uniref:stalk domain-containing protein n=1 Tax=Paenibacillus sp. D9 TaxID=665792 RepID=UPI00061EAACA|nr:stalk domain-containing protein [Paenibacillus sp. D9]KKC49540.1 hypothetical protein VE23_24900 [Paenibacillus sp. D9]